MTSDMNHFAMVTQDSTNQHFKRQSNKQLTSVNSFIISDLQRPSRDCNKQNQTPFKIQNTQQLTSANTLTNFDFQLMAWANADDDTGQHQPALQRQSCQQLTSVNSLINSNLRRPSRDCNNNSTSQPSTDIPSSIWLQQGPSLTSMFSLWLQGSPSPHFKKQTRQWLTWSNSSNWLRLPTYDFGY